MGYFLLLFALAVTPFALYHWRKRARRAQLLARRLSTDERALMHAQVPLTRKLPADLHARLEGRICLFLDQVDFTALGGLELTEEMRLSIAAQACLLIVGTQLWYDNLRAVLIYPGAFKSRTQHHSGYVVTEEETVRLGESWSHGRIVLSWQHTVQGAEDAEDGVNVVFHEFAHQIDDLSGSTNGVPLLAEGQSFDEWESVFLKAYRDHVRRVERGGQTVIDPYGATAHEEFFAVVVELFFERPQALKEDEPKVYAQLSKLLALDPAGWADSKV